MNSRSVMARALRAFVFFLALAAGAATAKAQPGAFPARPIKIMVGFSPGGSTDAVLRVLAENASRILGQPVLIENRPGAAGVLPAQLLRHAAPDGYTLAQTGLNVFRLSSVSRIDWDPAEDLSHVIGIAGYAFGLVVPAESPIRSVDQFFAYARTHPGRLSYGSPGATTTPHLTMESLALSADVQLNHIPYKGVSESLQALLGGHVMAVADSSAWAPYVEQGKLRLLASWGDERLARFPEAPTLKELGLDMVQLSLIGLATPKGTDPKTVQILHDAFRQASRMSSYAQVLAQYDMVPSDLDGAGFKRYGVEAIHKEKPVLDRLGLLVAR